MIENIIILHNNQVLFGYGYKNERESKYLFKTASTRELYTFAAEHSCVFSLDDAN